MRIDAVPPVGSEGPVTRVTPPSPDPTPTTASPGAAGRPGTPGTTASATTTSATTTSATTTSVSATGAPAPPALPPLPGDLGAVAPARPATTSAPLAWALADRVLDDVGAVLARLADLVTTSRTATDPAARAGATAEAHRLVDQIVAALRARALAVPALSGHSDAGSVTGVLSAGGAAGGREAGLVLAVRDGSRPAGVLRLPIAGVTVSVPIPTVDAGAPYGSGRAALERFAAALRTDLAAAGLSGVLVVVDGARGAVRLVPALLVAGTAWPTAAGPEAAAPTPGTAAPAAAAASTATGRTTTAPTAIPPSSATGTASGGIGGSVAGVGAGPAAAAAVAAGAGERIGAAVRTALAENLRGLPDVRGVLAVAVGAADRRPVEAVAALLATTRAGIAALGLTGGHAVGRTGPGGDVAGLVAAVDDLAAAIIAAGPAALLAQTAAADRPAIVLLLLAGMLGHPGAVAPSPARADEPAAEPRPRRPDLDDEADAETGDGGEDPAGGDGGENPAGRDGAADDTADRTEAGSGAGGAADGGGPARSRGIRDASPVIGGA